MSILINKNTKVIVQGFTGRQGRTGSWKRHLTCLLDAIHPYIAPFGQLKLPKSVPDRFFPVSNWPGMDRPVVAPGMVSTMIYTP